MNRSARRPLPLAVRLVVLLLVPLSVLTLQAALAAGERSNTATQTADVQQRANAVSAVVRLGFAVMQERVALLTQLQVRRVGADFGAVATLLGESPTGWVAQTRAETDRALARLPGTAGLSGIRTRIAGVRRTVDAGAGAGAAGEVQALLEIEQTVRQRARELLGDLADRTEQLAATSSALRDVVALQLTYQAALLQAELVEGLLNLSGSPAGSAGSPAGSAGLPAGSARLRAQLRAQLAGDAARYAATAAEIDTMGSAGLRRSWHRILDSAATAQLDAVISAAVRSGRAPALGGSDLVAAAAVYRQALDRRRVHDQLVYLALGVVADDVRSLREQADAAYRAALGQGFVVGLLALVGALFLSRGVTRPLQEIATRARRIRDGDLSVDAAAGRGPREVVDVAEAFNDVAANLRLVEEQATALADGDTEHEVLRRRVPGRLGESLQLSVSRLSQSISASEELESRLRHEATHDRLTGLLNRASALVALEQGVARAHRTGGGLAVLVVDLDGLKRVNEVSGHASGDEVLRRAAARLAGSVRGGDILARLGADEFAVVAEVGGIESAVELGQRIVSGLAGIPVSVSSSSSVSPSSVSSVSPSAVSLVVGASVGVALTLDGRASPASLLRDADAAVHRAKEGGGGRIEVFDGELRRQLAERTAVEAALTAAMTRNQLRLCYQPIVSPDGRLRGLEALCRWTDPVLGVVPPTVFVAVAEASDLVIDLDRWVLAEALRQLAEWTAAGQFTEAYLSVNLSGRHLLGPAVVADVRAALAASRVDPGRLVLEITETVLLDDLLVAAQHLSELRELGVRVAVDDFGTGYTSIAHLQRLPIDIVKVDRSFISDLATERGHSLVRLMVDMARTLGLGLVAEGVETPLELRRLTAMDCPLIQGYLTGRPMPPADLLTWRTPTSPSAPSTTPS